MVMNPRPRARVKRRYGENVEEHTKIQMAVLRGDDSLTIKLIKQALKKKMDPADLVTSGLQAAMIEVGKKYSSGEFFVPDMLLASRAVTRAMDVLRSHLSNPEIVKKGRVVIGTTVRDIHDIGKKLVSIFLEGSGFEIIDLGTNISAEKFVAAVKEYSPDLLGMSALLTSTMSGMKDTIEALKSAGLREQVKVIIGGGPVTQRFSDQIGADGYGSDGGAAIELCRKLIGNKQFSS